MNLRISTLDEFTIQQYRTIPGATGELSTLLRDISLAAKRINVEVNRAGLADIIGDAGITNIQGENVKKLDLIANNQFTNVLRHSLTCSGICSEEMDDFVVFDDEISNNSKYVVMFDPLDGSSNIDTNVSIGTIFGIYKRKTELGGPCALEDFLQPGVKLVAAGYIIYGPSTMLVYATRRGVNGFTLDPPIGEFCLSHPNIACPENGNIYSVNGGYFSQYSTKVKNYIEKLQKGATQSGNLYTQRFTGSMVADLHRTLIKGGIFMYPLTNDHPNGKLRLIYECNPFAFIIEVAGGKASNGFQRILDIIPTQLHERTAYYVGSKNMVEDCLKDIDL
jgi:fructose-1,6-bisphosphatase I